MNCVIVYMVGCFILLNVDFGDCTCYPACDDCQQCQKSPRGDFACVSKAYCCPPGATKAQCLVNPCADGDTKCPESDLCIPSDCNSCHPIFYDKHYNRVCQGTPCGPIFCTPPYATCVEIIPDCTPYAPCPPPSYQCVEIPPPQPCGGVTCADDEVCFEEQSQCIFSGPCPPPTQQCVDPSRVCGSSLCEVYQECLEVPPNCPFSGPCEDSSFSHICVDTSPPPGPICGNAQCSADQACFEQKGKCYSGGPCSPPIQECVDPDRICGDKLCGVDQQCLVALPDCQFSGRCPEATYDCVDISPPAALCGNEVCVGEQVCYSQQVQCVRAPCPPLQQCVDPDRICGNYLCQLGEFCSDPAYAICAIKEQCGPDLYCNSDETCVIEFLNCYSDPCPPPHFTCKKPDRPPVECGDNIYCIGNEVCYEEQVQCFSYPCPPNKQCVDPDRICGQKLCKVSEECVTALPNCVFNAPCPPPTYTCLERCGPDLLCDPGQECLILVVDCFFGDCAGAGTFYECEQIPDPSQCGLVLCNPDEVCFEEAVQCYSSPCPLPNKFCVDPSEICGDKICDFNEVCVDEKVFCGNNAPCPPQKVCKPKIPCGPVLLCHPEAQCFTAIPDCFYGGPCPDPIYECEEIVKCGGSQCNSDEVCYDQQVQCFKAPCPPIQQCVDPERICVDKLCQVNEVCLDVQVQCSRAPCPPPVKICQPKLPCGPILCHPDQTCLVTTPACQYGAVCSPIFECIDTPAPPAPPPCPVTPPYDNSYCSRVRIARGCQTTAECQPGKVCCTSDCNILQCLDPKPNPPTCFGQNEDSVLAPCQCCPEKTCEDPYAACCTQLCGQNQFVCRCQQGYVRDRDGNCKHQRQCAKPWRQLCGSGYCSADEYCVAEDVQCIFSSSPCAPVFVCKKEGVCPLVPPTLPEICATASNENPCRTDVDCRIGQKCCTPMCGGLTCLDEERTPVCGINEESKLAPCPCCPEKSCEDPHAQCCDLLCGVNSVVCHCKPGYIRDRDGSCKLHRYCSKPWRQLCGQVYCAEDEQCVALPTSCVDPNRACNLKVECRKEGKCPSHPSTSPDYCRRAPKEFLCQYDDECPAGQRCCFDECGGRKCQYAVVPTPDPNPNCPKPPSFDADFCSRAYVVKGCDTTYDCQPGKECCPETCNILQCVDPKPPVNPNCPEAPYYDANACRRSRIQAGCKTSADCPSYQECCYSDCQVLQCVDPIPAPPNSQCPAAPPYDNDICSRSLVVSDCRDKYDCDYGQICCQAFCAALQCQDPIGPPIVKPGTCPATYSNTGVGCTRECTKDTNCRDDRKCCSYGCVNVCVKPNGTPCGPDLYCSENEICTGVGGGCSIDEYGQQRCGNPSYQCQPAGIPCGPDLYCNENETCTGLGGGCSVDEYGQQRCGNPSYQCQPGIRYNDGDDYSAMTIMIQAVTWTILTVIN